MDHIITVPDVGHFESGNFLAQFFPYSHDIRHHLAGVVKISQPVDHRDGGVLGEVDHHIVAIRTVHDAVTVAAEHAGGVADGLAAAHLQLLRRKIEGVAAELGHARFEGYAGAGGALLEDHGERTTGKSVEMGELVLFELLAKGEDIEYVLAHVEHGDDVAFHGIGCLWSRFYVPFLGRSFWDDVYLIEVYDGFWTFAMRTVGH